MACVAASGVSNIAPGQRYCLNSVPSRSASQEEECCKSSRCRRMADVYVDTTAEAADAKTTRQVDNISTSMLMLMLMMFNSSERECECEWRGLCTRSSWLLWSSTTTDSLFFLFFLVSRVPGEWSRENLEQCDRIKSCFENPFQFFF